MGATNPSNRKKRDAQILSRTDVRPTQTAHVPQQLAFDGHKPQTHVIDCPTARRIAKIWAQ